MCVPHFWVLVSIVDTLRWYSHVKRKAESEALKATSKVGTIVILEMVVEGNCEEENHQKQGDLIESKI